MIKNTNFAIIGRIPEDDEDTCCIYHDTTCEAACAAFRSDIYRYSDRKDQDKVSKVYGDSVFITCVLESDTKIKRLSIVPCSSPSRWKATPRSGG